MFDLIRLVSFVLILISVVLAAVLQESDEANDLGLKMRVVGCWLSGERKPSDEQTKTNQATVRHLEKKDRALQKLLDGQATLFETAAVFHRLNQLEGMQRLSGNYPGCSVEEQACLQVISWVRRAKADGETNLLVSRLEEELRHYKEQHATMILPEVEPEI